MFQSFRHSGEDPSITVSSFNVENLNPDEDRFDDLADIIVNNLNSPDILALQEIQDTLAGDVLTNLLDEEDAGEQYSYVFEGNSQVLDHILVSDNVNKVDPEFDIVHVNADRPETLQAADHEPLLMRFAPAPRYTRLLPILFKE